MTIMTSMITRLGQRPAQLAVAAMMSAAWIVPASAMLPTPEPELNAPSTYQTAAILLHTLYFE